MIKIAKSIMILLFALTCTGLYSEDDSLKNTSISYSDYIVNISSNQNRFFTGRLEVLKNGVPQFVMDSVFSDYVEHNIIDMDGNGTKELLVLVSEGASAYLTNSMFLFDSEKGARPLYTITNASLDTSVPGKPAINTYVLMSPSMLGFGYDWQMVYHKGKLRYKSPEKKEGELLQPFYDGLKSDMKEIWPVKVDCEDYIYSLYFEYIFITSMITGEVTGAENFFMNEYKCPDKVTSLIRFKKSANETLNWIKDEKNYLFLEY